LKDEEFVSKSKLESVDNKIEELAENTSDAAENEISTDVSTSDDQNSLVDTTENKES
jgi:uncharacterized protein YycO